VGVAAVLIRVMQVMVEPAVVVEVEVLLQEAHPVLLALVVVVH
jgi:hypothetical protein